jgi:hypothetical protein
MYEVNIRNILKLPKYQEATEEDKLLFYDNALKQAKEDVSSPSKK